jgi:hypothetical protein
MIKTESINYVSEFERLLIHSTLEAIFNEDDMYSCHKCLQSFASTQDEEKREAALNKMRKLKGCWGAIRGAYRVDKYDIYTCVGNYAHYQVHEIFGWYQKYEQFGILPYAGSLYDQPAKIMEIFDIMGNIKYKKMKAKQEADKIKAKHRNRLNRK